MQQERAPIIKSFRILGLHGYKDIEIDFPGVARIVIAENGSGKTTILSAMQAFLGTEFERLSRLVFESIECDFASLDRPLVLKHEDLPQALDPQTHAKLSALAEYSSAGFRNLRRAILESDLEEPSSLRGRELFQEIYYQSPMSWDDIGEIVSEVGMGLRQAQSPAVAELGDKVRAALSPLEILYLPTYRRVELPLAKRVREDDRIYPAFRPPRRSAIRDRYSEANALDEIGIQFGLADVQRRLMDLINEIQRKSNLGYRAISASIIDELLRGAGPSQRIADTALPEIAALQQFFSRIDTRQKRSTKDETGETDRRLKAIQVLYDSGSIHEPENRTLGYFLSKLARVVDETRELEASIEQFVERVNEYLIQSSDEKKLQYDASRMKVEVRNQWSGAEVKLDDLSSGEKQVLSLLAHLYLHDERKIILIDEPELSLSIDWQKRLLPDIVDAPTCAQLLAITHSPFIFDNNLDPYAGPLKISRREQ